MWRSVFSPLEGIPDSCLSTQMLQSLQGVSRCRKTSREAAGAAARSPASPGSSIPSGAATSCAWGLWSCILFPCSLGVPWSLLIMLQAVQRFAQQSVFVSVSLCILLLRLLSSTLLHGWHARKAPTREGPCLLSGLSKGPGVIAGHPLQCSACHPGQLGGSQVHLASTDIVQFSTITFLYTAWINIEGLHTSRRQPASCGVQAKIHLHCSHRQPGAAGRRPRGGA